MSLEQTVKETSSRNHQNFQKFCETQGQLKRGEKFCFQPFWL